MSAKFTPGPWMVGGYVRKCEIGGFRAVCPVPRKNGSSLPTAYAATEVDARLIAASPEMYEALQNVRTVMLMEATLNPSYGWREYVAEQIDPLLARIDGDTK